MLPIAYYFLQVVLCSAMMMGYYWLVLRNKRFHQYNRFYLLAIALLSWIVPLIKIQWGYASAATDPRVMQFLSVVADNNSQIEETLIHKGFQWNWEIIAMGFYVTVSTVLLLTLAYALVRIYKLLKEHSCKSVGDVYLILTQAKGTPFSFFRYIFWNEEIDIRSDAGKQILQHELTHVQQKHSVDKIFIQLMLVVGWFNPFFWLLKREMEMIHEFIADKKAVNNGDTGSLAQMLLTAAYPKQQFALTHPFFFSPIKRRLQMLTNTKDPRFSYLRRLVVLPLLAIVVVLFAFRNKDKTNVTTLSVASVVEDVVDRISDMNQTPSNSVSVIDIALLNRTYTVVIDAGHGGKDKGEIATDGTTESELTLKLAKTIRELNQNENIRILLRRDGDIFENTVAIADKVNKQNPDLYLTIHINKASPVKMTNGQTRENPASGIELFVPDQTKATDYKGSVALANYINGSLTSLREKMLGIKSREKGIWVLNNVKSPAVLLEAGFISNEADLKKLKDAAYQKQMAAAVLQGINHYFSKPVQNKLAMEKLGLDTIVIRGKADTDEKKLVLKGVQHPSLQHVLMVLDGKKTDNAILQTLDPDQIESVTVLKNESAAALYGEDGRNGVIIITTKKAALNEKLLSISNVSIDPVKGDNLGTYEGIAVKRRADSTAAGRVYLKGLKLATASPLYIIDGVKADDIHTLDPSNIDRVDVLKDAAAIVKYGEEARNGVVVISTKKKEELMRVENVFSGNADGEKVFIQSQVPVEFPGGGVAWVKYLERNLNKDIAKKNGGPPGKYTVSVSFIVDKSGNVSDVKAENDPGYGTKEEALRLIKSGPKWKPALQNGQPVIAAHKVSISFVVPEEGKNAGITNVKISIQPGKAKPFLERDSAGNVHWKMLKVGRTNS
ncbi:MAG: N-acetylmuramoyl-L-alanine amidase [Bacteroidota bacterium]